MHSIDFKGRSYGPTKIVCVGRNYSEHIRELGHTAPDRPVIFNKPPSSLSQELKSHHQGERIHYEAELSFLCLQGELAAVALGLDLTKRETQNQLKKAALPWERAKGFRGAALFSAFVPFQDLDQLHLELQLDGQMIQKGGTADMIHYPSQLLDEVQSFMDVEDGDVLMTGTPKGVGALTSGGHYWGKVFEGDREIVSQRWECL